tara:strand:+ start:3588 stop:3869 length:282 start_codon:yes stop_codon:yes gene_type:complete
VITSKENALATAIEEAIQERKTGLHVACNTLLFFIGVCIPAQRSKIETIPSVDAYLRLEIVNETPKSSYARCIALITVVVRRDNETLGLFHKK